CLTTDDANGEIACPTGVCPNGDVCGVDGKCHANGTQVCDPGYVRQGTACVDVDECAAPTSPCDAHADCMNLPGTYQCTCDVGYSGDGNTCHTDYVEVAAEADHACAVRSDHTLWCWGQNNRGQLGLGVGPERLTPTQVPGAWVYVSVGALMT